MLHYEIDNVKLLRKGKILSEFMPAQARTPEAAACRGEKIQP